MGGLGGALVPPLGLRWLRLGGCTCASPSPGGSCRRGPWAPRLPAAALPATGGRLLLGGHRPHAAGLRLVPRRSLAAAQRLLPVVRCLPTGGRDPPAAVRRALPGGGRLRVVGYRAVATACRALAGCGPGAAACCLLATGYRPLAGGCCPQAGARWRPAVPYGLLPSGGRLPCGVVWCGGVGGWWGGLSRAAPCCIASGRVSCNRPMDDFS